MTSAPARPRDAAATRAAIADVAGRMFAERGYAGTPIRDVAAAAGIDPALVIRHFGSKEALFLATMRLDLEPNPLLEGSLETLGERFVAALLAADDRVRATYLALVHASGTGDLQARLREVHEAAFVEPLRGRLSGADADVRARLAAALVGGLLYALWVVGDDELAATDPAELARRYGALLQSLLTPPT